MGKETGISWTDHTFNPWRGCTKVSAGCTNCYAETLSRRNPGVLGVWGDHGTRVVASEAKWREPLAWNDAARLAGVRRRVFCASLADVFEDRPELVAPRERLFGLIAATKRLDWLILTKRPQIAAAYFRKTFMWGAAAAYRDLVHGPKSGVSLGDGLADWPPRNVWLGVSVEDQARADERIPVLLGIPAAVRFVSYEPALGPVDFTLNRYAGGTGRMTEVDQDTLRGTQRHYTGDGRYIDGPLAGRVDWLIAGAESGTGRRPFDLAWLQAAADQCDAAEVPLFVKQDSAFKPGQQGRIPDALWSRKEFPAHAA